MPFQKLVFRTHVIERMFERRILEADVRQVLQNNEVIENYDADYPLPSKLFLGFQGKRGIHVVAADDPKDQITIVITVYEPDPLRWEPNLRRRRRT